jgi:hypothetical protein
MNRIKVFSSEINRMDARREAVHMLWHLLGLRQRGLECRKSTVLDRSTGPDPLRSRTSSKMNTPKLSEMYLEMAYRRGTDVRAWGKDIIRRLASCRSCTFTDTSSKLGQE